MIEALASFKGNIHMETIDFTCSQLISTAKQVARFRTIETLALYVLDQTEQAILKSIIPS